MGCEELGTEGGQALEGAALQSVYNPLTSLGDPPGAGTGRTSQGLRGE